LKIAAAIRADGRSPSSSKALRLLGHRPRRQHRSGEETFVSLEKLYSRKAKAAPNKRSQEFLENLINEFI